MDEVVAIRQAVKYIIGRQLRQAKIIWDSRSVLMSLASMHEKRAIINEIKDNKKEYLGDIQLIWIRAHGDSKGTNLPISLQRWPRQMIMRICPFLLLEFKFKMPLGWKFWRHGNI
ncbi:hypothetical protein AVEN_99986-1 [Araneus ventricosus]|uniref:Uncharacterized protein n=1 Tax=Araneus ventricosus TaxID=182803 RepID=A0A4Y2JU11_ARAVE|nr:hypothetical protein AVEN_99986-1 [Araneus ventricosus]